MNEPRPRGLLTSFVALGGIATASAAGAWLSQPAALARLRDVLGGSGLWSACGAVAPLLGAATLLAIAAKRMPRESHGRMRLLVLGNAATVLAVCVMGLLVLLRMVAQGLPAGSPMAFDELMILSPQPARGGLVIATTGAAIAALVHLGASIASWFLAPERARRRVFVIVDALLFALTIWLVVTVRLPREGESVANVTGPALRLGFTFLFLVRLFLRALPWTLDFIEHVGFRSLVAARHLRAKKSGFLAAISLLSILAVSVSSCALTTTLSVMGGFRQDLKRKILGNNAHIVLDRAEGRIDDSEALTAKARAATGVRGVSAYVSGEVMVSSSSNLSGAVLRGIDLDHIGEVSELPSNVVAGSLDYLKDPSRLSHAPADNPDAPRGKKLTPKVARGDSEQDAKPQAISRLTEEIDRLLREEEDQEEDVHGGDTTARGVRAREQPTSSQVPGIVVGQELARSLRLYVGDEVNIVTPLGDLGPTGPMPKSRPFRVAAIFYSGMYEYDMKFVYVTLETAQRFLGAGQAVSGVEITVREPDRAPEVAAALAGELAQPTLRVRAWQELNKNLFGALALEKLAMFIALGVAILVASFCIVGTLTLMVQEKGREVAVLKAMGARDSSIVGIFVLEGTFIGALGSALGLALGYGMCFAAAHLGVRLNPEVYYIDRLPVHIDASEFLTVGIAAIIVCLLVTIYPAKLASRLRPVDALRYE